MNNKIYSLIGLATKAGKLASGDETCERAIKAGKVNLIIVSEDASDNTKKKFSDACRYRGVEIRFFGEKVLLGRYTGKELRSVIAILENGFAKRLIEMIDGKDLLFGGEEIGKS
jgi:ribosomal protein L7Ae-like RNA K-turn-binding protein